MSDLLSVVEARGYADVANALLGIFGDDAALFVIDHAFEQLVEVTTGTNGGSARLLDDELRVSMLENRPYVDGSMRWVPISDREQPVLVVRVPVTTDLPPDDVMAQLGPIANDHRNRFEELERIRRRSSMSVAAEMQWASLPNRADRLGDYAIGSVLEPAYEVAGDAFDYAAADGAIWVYSLDGMGHGLAAATASVMALAAIRNERRRGGGLDAQMAAADAALFDEFGGDRFVTGLACRIDADGVEFVNAGHEPAWRVTGSQASRLELTAELPLGVVGSHEYRLQRQGPLDGGDGIVLFSDGPTNSHAPDGTAYSADRLRERLEAHWWKAPLRTAHEVIADVLGFIGSGKVTDDITAVVVRRETSAA
ncbi:PP2C family protein-serine/threonine phosphatase [Ilumatobacter coccineus]|uniref:PP2C family protein-serine/threonine phosphatase n=1 Tax=Ilumatobacter coccineus TaxID=467094 RepID=UPI00034B0D13|nr:SpoIIE family protein phosphatase [Ilumatobacter coccineus]